MFAGAAKLDITPESPVWMDGMIRAHRSEGVHDRLYARCLALSGGRQQGAACAIISVDVCGLDAALCAAARQAAAAASDVPAESIIIAATHTHSGPATIGFFNAREEEYNARLVERIAGVVRVAAADMRPASASFGLAADERISHYRRLLAADGHVVMNWEPYDPGLLRGPLGEADPDVGVLRLAERDRPQTTIAVFFNHSGHPNVMSGENYLLSADYPGRAAALVEERFGGVAVFVNGAQGSVDIDGLRDRDWEGVERLGSVLAQAVSAASAASAPLDEDALCSRRVTYTLPARQITDKEMAWAQSVLARTGGTVAAQADGVGDDYLAVRYRDLRAVQDRAISIEQVCLAVGECALISFPGELYTEIGREIKARSPFRRTCIVGLANGYVGYVPTARAIAEGGYAEDTRGVDETAEEIVVRQSLALLGAAHTACMEENT